MMPSHSIVSHGRRFEVLDPMDLSYPILQPTTLTPRHELTHQQQFARPITGNLNPVRDIVTQQTQFEWDEKKTSWILPLTTYGTLKGIK